MKKIFTIFSAAMMSVLLTVACVEKEKTVYYPDKAVAPVLEEIAAPESSYVLVEDSLTLGMLRFSRADFGMPVAVRYTLYAALDESFANAKAVDDIDNADSIFVEDNALNNALVSLACAPDKPVTVYFRIGAQMRGDGLNIEVDPLYSNVRSTTVTPYNAEKTYPAVYVVGDPWGWPDGTWSNTEVLRYLYSYAEDEENYVGVIDFGENRENHGFKITGGMNWNEGNWGVGSETSTEAEAPSIVLWDDGGSTNINNYSEYRYYNFHFVRSTLTLNVVKSFNSVGISGSMTDWADGADIVMTQMLPDQRFYADVEIETAAEFKFRLDGAWTTSWGGTVDELELNSSVNLKIEDPGNYRIYLDINDWDGPAMRLSAEDYGTSVE